MKRSALFLFTLLMFAASALAQTDWHELFIQNIVKSCSTEFSTAKCTGSATPLKCFTKFNENHGIGFKKLSKNCQDAIKLFTLKIQNRKTTLAANAAVEKYQGDHAIKADLNAVWTSCAVEIQNEPLRYKEGRLNQEVLNDLDYYLALHPKESTPSCRASYLNLQTDAKALEDSDTHRDSRADRSALSNPR